MPKSVFTDEYEIFLDLLVKARKGAGVTQVELGRRLGKPQPWVSNIERSIRRIDILEFIAIARALNWEPDKLFSIIISELPKEFVV